MSNTLSHKTKQFFFVPFKMSIVIGAFYVIHQKLYEDGSFNFSSFLTENSIFSLKNITFLFLLTAFNWFFEILKWKNLVNIIKSISFFEALKQTLSAHTVAILTPNRIGDYGAKALFYRSKYRKKILLLNGIANTAQLSTTIVFGCVGLTIFLFRYDVILFSNYNILIGAVTIILICILTVLLLKNKSHILKKSIAFIKQITPNIHLKIVLFSVIRYVIFSFQYYYLLLIFGAEVSCSEAMVIITSMYLITSVIPTFFIFDTLVKGGVAIYLFSVLQVPEIIILFVAMSMWLLNFVLPTIFGSIFILRLKSKSFINSKLEMQY